MYEPSDFQGRAGEDLWRGKPSGGEREWNSTIPFAGRKGNKLVVLNIPIQGNGAVMLKRDFSEATSGVGGGSKIKNYKTVTRGMLKCFFSREVLSEEPSIWENSNV